MNMAKDPSCKIHFQMKGNKHKLFPDLTDEELFAIGRVTASFAHLEHALFMDSLAIVHRHRIKPFPEKILVVSLTSALKHGADSYATNVRAGFAKRC